MKKIFILLLAALMLISAVGCTETGVKEPQSVETVTQKPKDDPIEEPDDADPTEADPTEDDENPDDADPTEAEPAEVDEGPTEAPAGEVTVGEQVLVDEKDIRITLKSIEVDTWFGPELKVLIENDSDTDLTFTIKNACVNGYMNSASLYTQVAAGKKATDEITLSSSDLEACGIETVAIVDLSFNIHDDNYKDYLETDLVTVKTSADAWYDYTFDDSGKLAFEKKDVKIVVKGLTDESIFGPGVLFYVENNSKKTVLITSDDVSVNGFMVSDLLYCTVLPGKHAIDASTLMESDLEDNDIEEIEEIEMTFRILDAGSWKTIAESDPVKISF